MNVFNKFWNLKYISLQRKTKIEPTNAKPERHRLKCNLKNQNKQGIVENEHIDPIVSKLFRRERVK